MLKCKEVLLLALVMLDGYKLQASTSSGNSSAKDLQVKLGQKTVSWQDKVQTLLRLRNESLTQAKILARVYVKDSALLVRFAAVEVLAESLLSEDLPLLKEQLKDERNYYKGRALLVVERVQQLLAKIDPNLLNAEFN
ncbi:MAG: hypothetical protein N2Z70_02070 [Bdellovibrionaceae bacterium]|jgi:hypothetical protein|nr:hypothetical protein [Pseudobdellovibrionaceae bacterium]